LRNYSTHQGAQDYKQLLFHCGIAPKLLILPCSPMKTGRNSGKCTTHAGK
jgi:hypothetical protein